MGHVLVAPLAAADDGDAQDLGVGRLDRREGGEQVGGRGASSLRLGSAHAEQWHQQQAEKRASAHDSAREVVEPVC